MGGRSDQGEPKYQELGVYLQVLGQPNRLELLRKLQLPQTLQEIALGAVRARGPLRPERRLSRQAVQQHLDKLIALGLVEAREGRREGRVVTEYVVNHGRLFVVVEELRRLSLLRAAGAPAATQSRTRGPGDVHELPDGPALVLAGGPLEGRAFPLRGAGPWTVGRERRCDVALPYDPFISKHNSRVHRTPRGFTVETLPGSRNGTRVNWRLLPEGAPAPLVPGDFLGVGRSLLVLRTT